MSKATLSEGIATLGRYVSRIWSLKHAIASKLINVGVDEKAVFDLGAGTYKVVAALT